MGVPFSGLYGEAPPKSQSLVIGSHRSQVKSKVYTAEKGILQIESCSQKSFSLILVIILIFFLGSTPFFPRCRDDRFAHKWLQKHISSHDCGLFCEA